MPSFRCYGLDHNDRVVVAEDVEATDANEAIGLGWRFVASHQIVASHHADLRAGLEVWHGGNLIFTTVDRPGQRAHA
jgi:hypothetical protein